MNEATKAVELQRLAELTQQADDLVEQIHNQLEEMVQAGTLTSAEYDMLMAEVPRTNLSELRRRLELAAEGKLRPRHLNSLLDDLLG